MFHTRLLAAIAASGLPSAKAGRAATDGLDALWLNRLTFGATPASREEIAVLGHEAWLERQLSLPPSDPDLEARLAAARLKIAYPAGAEDGSTWTTVDELRPLSLLNTHPADLVRLIAWGPGKGMDYAERQRPAQEVIAASLIRAVHAEAQLREVMTQFWHDHFSVNSAKDETTAAFFGSHDAILRDHAFGNFRQLLGEVARSPAMLYYLNNADSLASPANENYARELLELHTLGAGNYLNDRYDDWRTVPGAEAGRAEGYLDLDVYEVARAFTGWSVGDGRWVAEGETAPLTGRFHYIARWHDPYQKRILGREFPPNRGPMADGDEVLDILASHPGTADFICTKIARRFLADDPPKALVARMAATFLAAASAEDQIAQVLRGLVLSPEFSAPPTKIRRPFEFLAAELRALGAEVISVENGFHWQLGRAGWQQHEYGPPTGHPDKLEAWTGSSTLNRMIDLALYGTADWFDGGRVDLSVLESEQESLADFATRSAAMIAPREAAAIAATLLEAFGQAPDTLATELSGEDRQGLATAAAAFAAISPDFLLR